MKLKINVLFSTLFLIACCFSSCKKNEDANTQAKQELTFSFDLKNLKTAVSKNLKCSYLKEAAKYVVLTIEKSNGEKLYESKRLELYNFNGNFISESLSVEVNGSPYSLTQFLILDENFEVIFAAPLEGSPLASLVTNPLPLHFTVSKDQITKVVPDVLSTESTPVKDFGYASFDFKLIMTQIKLLINVQVFNASIKNWELTNAYVSINGYHDNIKIYYDTLSEKTNTISLLDGYDHYRITVWKDGHSYIRADTTLTNEQVKTYYDKPLIISLKNEAGPVTDIEGNVYNTVTIGTQVWMAENLKTTKYRNGDPIPNITENSDWNNLTTGALCWFNNDPSNQAIYGPLYNWYAVTDSRNIAPVGWHVPTDDEFTTLVTYLGGSYIAGGKLKEAGTTHWLSPNRGDFETGFAALPGSFRNPDGSFFTMPNREGEWWSSTVDLNNRFASSMVIIYDYTQSDQSLTGKESGFSVRCIRN